MRSTASIAASFSTSRTKATGRVAATTRFPLNSRKQPAGWQGGARRIDRAMLESEGFPPAMKPRIFICGPTQLVESASQIMLDLGHDRTLIKTERFGPTGG